MVAMAFHRGRDLCTSRRSIYSCSGSLFGLYRYLIPFSVDCGVGPARDLVHHCSSHSLGISKEGAPTSLAGFPYLYHRLSLGFSSLLSARITYLLCVLIQYGLIRQPDARGWDARESAGSFPRTVGTLLLGFNDAAPTRVLTPDRDSRSGHRLLYLAAVRDDRREQEHCQGRVDIGPGSPQARSACDQ